MSGATRSGRRGRWANFPTDDELPPEPAPVPRLGPVVFGVRFGDGERIVDLSDLPCPRLVRPLAAALRDVGGEDGSVRHWAGFLRAVNAARDFVRFVADDEQATDEFAVADLEAGHMDGFEQALIRRHGPGSHSPHVAMGHLVRLLRRVHEDAPQEFAPELVARIGFVSRQAALAKRRPLDAYPPQVFEAITNAALADVQAISRRITAGEALAERGRDPAMAGWDEPANVAWHVRQHGPVTNELVQTSAWLGSRLRDHGGLRQVNRMLYLSMEDLLPFVVAVVCVSGLEPECAKQLRVDCLINPARGFVTIRYVKRRAHGQENKTLRVSDGGSLRHPGGLIRLARRLTQRARDEVGGTALWVDHNAGRTRESFATHRVLSHHAGAWMQRHGLDALVDHDGRPVRLHLPRLRKSFKSQQYLRAAGVLVDFTHGHTPQTAAGHYADIGAHRDIHERAVEDGLRQAMEVALPAPTVLDEQGNRLDDADQQLPAEQVRAALSGRSDVFLASCRDFYDTPFAAKGKPCPVALWGCLECPNAVFTTRHLPQVLAFLDFIERQREEYTVAEWNLRYGVAFERIVGGIRSKFRPDQIATAAAIAEDGGRLLLPPQFWEGVA